MSPDGTTVGPPVKPSLGPPIFDGHGRAFAIDEAGFVTRDGVRITGKATLLRWLGGSVFARSPTGGIWWQWTGTSWRKGTTADPVPVIVPPPPPLPTPIGVSPNGTTVPPAVSIVDAQLKAWTLGPAVGSAFQILNNGVQYIGGIGSVIKMDVGIVKVLATDGRWYTPTANAWVDSALGAVPSPPPPPPPPPPSPSPLPAPASIAAPLWDGASGITWQYANFGYVLPWVNPGGDWLDANQIAQGTTAFAVASFPNASPSSTDITSLVRRWYALGNTGLVCIKNAGLTQINTRRVPDASLWPKLSLYDGTQTVVAPCVCCSAPNNSTVNPIFDSIAVIDNGSNCFMQFAIPAGFNVVSATLILTQPSNSGPTNFKIYEAKHPKLYAGDGTVVPGLASNYAKDFGITADPAVLFATDFSSNWKSYFDRGSVTSDSYRFEPDLGVNGMEMFYTAGSNGGPMDANHVFSNTGVGPDELFFRYYLKAHAGYLCASQGKKLPGLAGRYGILKMNPVAGRVEYDGSLGGNGGNRVTGRSTSPARPSAALSGWSARHLVWTKPADANPLPPVIMLFQYAYHARMEGYYGDNWPWGNAAVGFVGLKEDRWYCIEQRVKMNSLTGAADANGNQSANADGVMQGWIDGVLVMDKQDVIWRYHPDIHVDEVWLDHYEGGMLPIEARHDFSMAALVVATSYIGPMAGIGGVAQINNNFYVDSNPCAAEQTGGSCLYTGQIGDRDAFDNWSGGIYNPYLGSAGSLMMMSGGEGYNGPGRRLDIATGLWSVATALPTVINGTSSANDPTFNTSYGTFGGKTGGVEWSPSNGLPFGVAAPPHTYDCLEILPPSMGGGVNGSLIFPTRKVYYIISSSARAVKCDLASKIWSAASLNTSLIAETGGDSNSWVLDEQNRRFLGMSGSSAEQGAFFGSYIYSLDFPDNSGVGVHNRAMRVTGDYPPPGTPCQVMGNHAQGRIVLAGGAGGTGLSLMGYDPDLLDGVIHQITTVNNNFPAGYFLGHGVGLAYCPDTGEFWACPPASSDYSGFGDSTQHTKTFQGVYRIVPAANRWTGTWNIYYVPVSKAIGYSATGVWKRFMYHPPSKSVIWTMGIGQPVYSFRVA